MQGSRVVTRESHGRFGVKEVKRREPFLQWTIGGINYGFSFSSGFDRSALAEAREEIDAIMQ